MGKPKIIEDSNLKRLGGVLVVLGLIGAAFYADPLIELFKMVLRREESSHGLFVPILSLYFVWWKKSSFKDIRPKCEVFAGLAVLMGGLLLLLLAKAHEQFYWECISFIVVLAGLVICFFGTEIFKEVGFPIFFLIFMIPLPEPIYNLMADWTRQATMKSTAGALAMAGVPFLNEGLLIHLPNATLKVNIGCSGIRYLLSYFVFAVAYAYLYRARFNQRIFLVCLSIPISLLASTLRLTIIALLAYYVSPQMAQYRPHVLTSWLIFFSVLMFSIGFDRWLWSRIEREGPEGMDSN